MIAFVHTNMVYMCAIINVLSMLINYLALAQRSHKLHVQIQYFLKTLSEAL